MIIERGIIDIYPGDRLSNIRFNFCNLIFHMKIKGSNYQPSNDIKYDLYGKDHSDDFKKVFGRNVEMYNCAFEEIK